MTPCRSLQRASADVLGVRSPAELNAGPITCFEVHLPHLYHDHRYKIADTSIDQSHQFHSTLLSNPLFKLSIRPLPSLTKYIAYHVLRELQNGI